MWNAERIDDTVTGLKAVKVYLVNKIPVLYLRLPLNLRVEWKFVFHKSLEEREPT